MSPCAERRVRRLPKDPGAAPWSALLPPPPPPRILQERVTADWLVIGGGFAGLAAARRLTQLRPGDRIALLEATRIGDGPAGRNTGFMIDLPHKLSSEDYAGAAEADRRETAQNRAAIAFAAEAVEEYGLPEEAFAQSGKINAAATTAGDRQNRSYRRHLEALGEASELLDAAEMKRLTGCDYYLSGLYTPGTAMLQPALFTRGIAAGLADKIDLFENSPVTALKRVDGLWRAKTPGGAVTSPKLILAVNGHAESFGYFARRLVHIHLYGSMTRALGEDEIRRLGGEPRWGLTPADPMGGTVRRISGTGGDRIIVRSRVSYTPSLEIDEARLETMGRAHDKGFRARFPMLAGVAMAQRWGGRLCLSLNDAPAFGEIEEGVFAACCQNGLGAARGTLSGMSAADLAAQGNAPHVAELLAAEPPSPLPPAPLDRIGATATLAWKEWRAGRER
ncbi:MAG: FAD-binding oxidoreductase [Pseudomonadota bacterium]